MLAIQECLPTFNPEAGWSLGTYAWKSIARACHEEILWLIDGKHRPKGSRSVFVNDAGKKVKGFQLFGPSLSLDAPIGEESTLHGLLDSGDEDLRVELRDLVAKDRTLDKRERRIVLGRIDGISGAELARREELSRSRITQIWNEAAAKFTAKLNTKRKLKIEDLAEFYLRTSPKTGGPKANPKAKSTDTPSLSFPGQIRYVADMTPEELRASERHHKEAKKGMPEPSSNVGCEAFHNGPWIRWICNCDDLFPNVSPDERRAAHKLADELRPTA